MKQHKGEVSGIRATRSVSIMGPVTTKITEEMLKKFHELGQQSSDPITLYIGDSNGGGLDAFYRTHEFFDSSQIGSGHGCQLISVVQGWAQSTAAFLGVAGSRALMAKFGRLTFHGARCADYQKGMVLTWEDALMLAGRLRVENRKVAGMLAKSVAPRLIRRFLEFEAKSGHIASKSQRRHLPLFVDDIEKSLHGDECREVVHDAREFSKALDSFGPQSSHYAARFGRRRLDANCRKYLAALLDDCASDDATASGEMDVMNAALAYIDLKNAMLVDDDSLMGGLGKIFGTKLLTPNELESHSRLTARDENSADKYLFEKHGIRAFEVVEFCSGPNLAAVNRANLDWGGSRAQIGTCGRNYSYQR